jgi:hypothetical protein
MKTKIYSIVICFLPIYSFLFTSCDEGDTTKPVIELIEPEEAAELRIGSENGIHFEMNLSDNEQLASYKVEIHNNFDNHGHETDFRSGSETVPFTFEKAWNVSGRNTHVHHHEINIPENATEGKYHLMVYCTDAAGNESYVARNIVLSLTAEEDNDED